MAFAFQHSTDRPRTFGGCFLLCTRLAPTYISFSLFPRRLRGLPFPRWRQVHTGPPCLRKANSNCLFSVGGAMLTFADVVHLLFHEFASLSAGRFSFACIFLGPFQGFFFRHQFPPLLVKAADTKTSDAAQTSRCTPEVAGWMSVISGSVPRNLRQRHIRQLPKACGFA